MITVSICLIVKNEEDVLRRCLTCAKEIADEIIIVDTGSTDSTKLIAKEFTNKVYDFVWIDDFAAARNFAFSKATKEYTMWLDADDIILPEDIAGFLELKKTLPPGVDVVRMRYNTSFDKDGKPTFSFFRERLVKTERAFKWVGAVHEVMDVSGISINSEIAISHKKLTVKDSTRNLRIFESEIKKGHQLSARDKFYYARELTYHNRDKEAVIILEDFLNLTDGWIENKIEACRLLSQCYKRLKNHEMALFSLLKSLSLDSPRAEICCDIGDIFLERSQHKTAVFWYEAALKATRNDVGGGFVLPDKYGLYPHLQLCVCHYKLGDIKQSRKHHNKAAKISPNSNAVKFNKEFFKGLSN